MLFLFAFLAAGIYFARIVELPAASIPARVVQILPQILIFVLSALGVMLLALAPEEVMRTWREAFSGALKVPILSGVLVGAALATVYLLVLAPAITQLQSSIGDYVPPGSVLPAVSSNLVLFFIVNVLLAPFVEETLFRAIAIPALVPSLGILGASLLSCVCFGLLN